MLAQRVVVLVKAQTQRHFLPCSVSSSAFERFSLSGGSNVQWVCPLLVHRNRQAKGARQRSDLGVASPHRGAYKKLE
jgi:hypothetical protein